MDPSRNMVMADFQAVQPQTYQYPGEPAIAYTEASYMGSVNFNEVSQSTPVIDLTSTGTTTWVLALRGTK
ncbi:hypothetical protein MNBD_NITROSPINAE01-1107 [hydrothermal vent metagenome]|uniref:Uncharacterized protein n=1 Tax=hydrothermal vent metagenome TaxID=652676 RepID=A0A3B1BF04_9ZZZZ